MDSLSCFNYISIKVFFKSDLSSKWAYTYVHLWGFHKLISGCKVIKAGEDAEALVLFKISVSCYDLAGQGQGRRTRKKLWSSACSASSCTVNFRLDHQCRVPRGWQRYTWGQIGGGNVRALGGEGFCQWSVWVLWLTLSWLGRPSLDPLFPALSTPSSSI